MVDDQPEIRALMREMLGRLGWAVCVAESGAEARTLVEARKARLALALVDVVLPGVDGLVVARELKALHPKLEIVMLSGRLNEESRWIIREQGFRFLAKPFTFLELRDLVADLLGDASARGRT